MYQKPRVEKFGSFRELTQLGWASATDGASIFGIGSPGGNLGDCFEWQNIITCPDPSAS